MGKHVLEVVLKDGSGFQFVPVYETTDGHEVCKMVMKQYKRLNPNVEFCITHKGDM